MADVSFGPVSSMPGSVIRYGRMTDSRCDNHHDRPAVARVQGETDSYGCEYVDMCKQCVDEHRAYVEAERKRPKYCCWCKQEKLGVRPHRDMDEGTSGPLYDVCSDCRTEESKRLTEELAEYDRDRGDYMEPDSWND